MKIRCCLCNRNTDKDKDRKKIGSASVWSMIELHALKNGLEIKKFLKEDYMCLKCYAMVSHYRMTDRGPNKKIKTCKPVVFETIINKTVLRGFPQPVMSDTGTIETNNENYANTSSSVVDQFDFSITTNAQRSINQQPPMLTTEGIGNNAINEEENTYSSIIDVSDNSFTRDSSVSSDCAIGSVEFPAISESSDDLIETRSDVDNIYSPSIVDEETIENQSSESETESDNSDTVLTFKKISGTKNTQSKCFICGSPAGRNVVPWKAIQQVWFDKNCYVPKSNRTCKEHLNEWGTFTVEAIQKIEASKQDIRMKTSEFELWLLEVSKLSKSTLYNFENGGVEPEMYKPLLGISKEDFDNLVTYLHEMRNTITRSVRNALAMFLMLLRNNMKQEVIAHNFSTSQQVVSNTIDAVSVALEKHFVPLNLGYHHITRDEALEHHSIKLTSDVLGQSESRLYVICDCTYNYIEKPAVFELQRKTFSAHKKRNLLKPLYIVLPDGYILEAAGPYFCDSKNNDAANIRHHYKNSDILLFLEEDDCFIFDRGFRDVVNETTENGQSVVMPSLLNGKRTQFTCDEANESRKVTMNRWVVEAVNGRVKNIFPFFKHMIEGTYVPKIMRFNRIACAIINKYFPPLFTNKEFHEVISKVTKDHNSTINELKQEIEQLGIQRMTTRWMKADETTIPNFPQLTMDDLKRITLGSYQLTISEKYIQQHMKGDSHFGIFIHRDNDEIIRARIQSRFSRSNTHNTWIKFDENETGLEAIMGYYCSCKVGERTLGCCSHVSTVLRYLGHDRYEPPKLQSRIRLQWDAIDCNEGDVDSDDEIFENEL